MKSEYTKYAENLSVRDIPDNPARGIIYDKNLNQLTKNRKTYDFWITDSDINYQNLTPIEQDKIKESFRKINEIYPINLKEIDELLRSGFSSYRIAKRVPSDIAEKINNLDINWLASYEVYKRVYNFDYLAAHLLGTVNESGHGVSGIENALDVELAGIQGKKVAKTDLLGNELANQDIKKYEATDGYNVVTTIDTVISQYAETALEKVFNQYEPEKAIAIVMETKTGNILAMESYPTFSLNNPTKLKGNNTVGMTDEEKEELWVKAWDNPAVNWLYEPGSVSKLLTSAIGLDDNVFNEDTTVQCIKGEEVVSGTTLRCWVYPDEHGVQDMKTALANSCNPAFIQLGLKIGRDRLYDGLSNFDIPYRTNIGLVGENNPIFPEKSELNLVQIATMSYGHGYAVTPLQMLTAVNAIVNDGKIMQPHIYSKIIDNDSNVISEVKPKVIKQVISKKTSDRMKSLMENVANSFGGSMSFSNFKGIRYGAKTGTTLKLDETGNYNDDLNIHSLFLTAPIEDPKYSILVVIDAPKKPMTSTFGAGQVAREILLNILDYEGGFLEAHNSLEKATVPDITSNNLNDAIAILENSGFEYSLVNYKPDKEADAVDDLINKRLRDALSQSNNDNKEDEDREVEENNKNQEEKPLIEKYYYVEEQFPKPGSSVLPGATIIINVGVKEFEQKVSQ